VTLNASYFNSSPGGSVIIEALFCRLSSKTFATNVDVTYTALPPTQALLAEEAGLL